VPRKDQEEAMTKVLRNGAAAVFLVSALMFLSTAAQASPFETYCLNSSSQCFGYYIDFDGCNRECSDVHSDCDSWCGEVSQYPISFTCSPETGTPSEGHCYCSGCPL
jgi:hypothetical protein